MNRTVSTATQPAVSHSAFTLCTSRLMSKYPRMPTNVKVRKKLQPKTQLQSATSRSPPNSSGLSSSAELKAIPGLRQLAMKTGNRKTKRMRSL